MIEKRHGLCGCWKLTALAMEFQVSKRRETPFGADPNGYLILTPEGRMMTLITAKGRQFGQTDALLAGLFRSMMSYTGKYRVEGERFITCVDASWNEAWNGTEQERFFKIEGDRLDIVSGWAPHLGLPEKPLARGIISWSREA